MLIIGCTSKQDNQLRTKPLPVKALAVSEQTQSYIHTYVGTIEESANIPLSVQTAGRVTAVYVRQGDCVKSGQELLQIDDVQARNAVLVSTATLKQIQDGYDRAQRVYAEGGVTEQKMVELTTQLDQAKVSLAMAEKMLSDCILRAPSDGVIGEVSVHVGQNIAFGVPVINLLDMEGYKIAFSMAEADIAAVEIGDIGIVMVEAIGNEQMPIRVVEKNLVANKLAHTYTVKAILMSPVAVRRQLLPGMVAKVWLNKQVVTGFFVPTECVQTLLSGKYVWVKENGKAYRRQIEVGQYVSKGIVVTSGLVAGDTVITDGFQKIYSGAAVSDKD